MVHKAVTGLSAAVAVSSGPGGPFVPKPTREVAYHPLKSV